MGQPPPPAPAFVGLDVAKDRPDVHLRPSGEAFAVARDGPGLDALVARLRAEPPALVVLEATGGFEVAVAAALAAAGPPLAVVDPRRIGRFAKAVGRLAKTDRLDAEVIALFAEPVARRRQLVEMVTAEDDRRRQARDPGLKRKIEARLARPREALAGSGANLEGAVRASPARREREDPSTSAPGAGATTAGTVLALPPELGTLDRRRVAALAGPAPVSRDSGKRRGPREIAGGRGPLRAALYMAALVASRRDPVLAAAYRRLRAAGEPAKLALTAVMRRLLTVLDAMLRDGEKWKEA